MCGLTSQPEATPSNWPPPPCWNRASACKSAGIWPDEDGAGTGNQPLLPQSSINNHQSPINNGDEERQPIDD
jgi:hypothetical protein